MAGTTVLLCTGFFFLYTQSLIAQAPPKKKTVTTVVGYQQYRQKQWEKNQLPKNSIQYKTDIKYKTPESNIKPITNLHLPQRPVPVIRKVFFNSANPVIEPGLKFVIADTGSVPFKKKNQHQPQNIPGRNE